MKIGNIVGYYLVGLVLVSCSPQEMSISTATVTPTKPAIFFITPTPTVITKESLILEQDFENNTTTGLFDLEYKYGDPIWNIVADDTGNQVFCNNDFEGYSTMNIGSPGWTDYSIELRLKTYDIDQGSGTGLYARYQPTINSGYNAALGFSEKIAYLYGENNEIGYSPTSFETEKWYKIRIEAFGEHIRYLIDDKLIVEGDDSAFLSGSARFAVTPNTQVCIDDIRAWSLNESGMVKLIPSTLEPTYLVPTPTIDPLKKYEANFSFDFVENEGGLAPIRDRNTEQGFFIPRPGDPREIITIDQTYRVNKGESILIENKILMVAPSARGNIEIFGILTIKNSLLIWKQTEHQQTRVIVNRGGILNISDSYCFSGNQYWVNWDFEDGATVNFDHFVNSVWTSIRGSVNYTATNFSSVGLTLFGNVHDSRVIVDDAHYLWFEINPTEGTRSMTLPAKHKWVDWSLNDLWPNTTVEVKHSYLVERDVSINRNIHLTIKDATDGYSLGWGIENDGPGYLECELRGLGEPGNEAGVYYSEKTWDMPCNNSSLTLINSVLQRAWPSPFGYVHLKIYDSNLADTRNFGFPSTMEIYNSSIGIVAVYDGGRVYVENSTINEAIEVKDQNSRIYLFGVTGNYELLESDGGKSIILDNPGVPWK